MHEQLKLGNQLCFRLYTLTRLITQAYRPLLQPLGLTYPQYLVMLVLWEQDNLTVGDICHRLRLDTNTLTPLLQRMEREGLVVRKRGLVDGRQTIVTLTKKGKRLEERAASVPDCMSQNWHGDAIGIDELTNMVNTIDTLIDGMK
ncbi:MAG: MarR family transcriptional regulator [Bacteroidales bacterium]|nr:MarR family transcriptional regulator [Bacteroidales bacterium]